VVSRDPAARATSLVVREVVAAASVRVVGVARRVSNFLDEIGELLLSVQPKLLRALQEGEIQRVGSDKLLRVDVRVVTNRDLAREVDGRFRSDLFHRLSFARWKPTMGTGPRPPERWAWHEAICITWQPAWVSRNSGPGDR
jgi:sigma54-dependent transcription regulator